MNQVFQIGDKMEITPVKSAFSSDKKEKKYSSQLLDFDEVRTAQVAAPMQDGRLVPLRLDDDVELSFFTKGGLYRCRGRIRKRYEDNRIPVLDVLIVSEPKKFQRREYYRLECSFELQYRRLSREELRLREEIEDVASTGDTEKLMSLEMDLAGLPQNWQTASISDLSAGGVRFHLSERLDPGETIELAVPLSMKNGMRKMMLMAHVIDCDRSEDARANAADARCEFESISDKERELIVKYVFEEQRRRMSGGQK